MPKSLIPPLIVLSLGNPAPYERTLHSAGHMALRSLVLTLRTRWRKLGNHPARHDQLYVRPKAHSKRFPPTSAQDASILQSLKDDTGYRWQGTPMAPNPPLIRPEVVAPPQGRPHKGKYPKDLNKPKRGKYSGNPLDWDLTESETRILLSPPQPVFQHRKVVHAPPHNLSLSPRFCLHQSPSLMNVSGRFSHMLYTDAMLAFNKQFQSPALRHLVMPTPFVVVHDELELPLGVIQLKQFWSSHKGHNGVKAVQSQMRKCTDMGTWFRVAIGIGRPESRSPADVSEWVLREVTNEERQTLDNIGGDLLQVLETVEDRVEDTIRGVIPQATFDHFEEQQRINEEREMAEVESGVAQVENGSDGSHEQHVVDYQTAPPS